MAIKKVTSNYNKRGFKVSTVLLDGEIEMMRGELSAKGLSLNSVSNNDRVPEIEQDIRTLKDWVYSIYNTL
jgi:hypothetical protein